jgi:hypothetical protein
MRNKQLRYFASLAARANGCQSGAPDWRRRFNFGGAGMRGIISRAAAAVTNACKGFRGSGRAVAEAVSDHAECDGGASALRNRRSLIDDAADVRR